MAPAELTDEWALNLIGSNGSQQEFFALPDMQCDGVPARGLVLGEVLERIAPVSGDIINKRDVIRHIGADRLRMAPTVVRLTRMSASGRLIPSKHLIIVFGMAIANLVAPRGDRLYGPDGKPIKDVDWGHDHGQGQPHTHEWIDGERQPGRPATEEESFSGDGRGDDGLIRPEDWR